MVFVEGDWDVKTAVEKDVLDENDTREVKQVILVMERTWQNTYIVKTCVLQRILYKLLMIMINKYIDINMFKVSQDNYYFN